MKNLKIYLLAGMVITISLSVLLAACGEKEIPDNPKDTLKATIRYEASVSDNMRYKIRISYIDENARGIEDAIVSSPWSYEMKNPKTGKIPLPLVVSPVSVGGSDINNPDKHVTAKIYVDGKLHAEHSGTTTAVVVYAPVPVL
jgi:hypothetical protein